MLLAPASSPIQWEIGEVFLGFRLSQQRKINARSWLDSAAQSAQMWEFGVRFSS
jgi:hypothetical protein